VNHYPVEQHLTQRSQATTQERGADGPIVKQRNVIRKWQFETKIKEDTRGCKLNSTTQGSRGETQNLVRPSPKSKKRLKNRHGDPERRGEDLALANRDQKHVQLSKGESKEPQSPEIVGVPGKVDETGSAGKEPRERVSEHKEKKKRRGTRAKT